MDDIRRKLSKEELEAKVTELEREVRTLREDLIHDSLTGLKTRKYFREEASKYFDIALGAHSAKRKDWFGIRNISFIFLDIDHFKKINDTHGHAVGDGVLKAVAMTVESCVRKEDVVARWGGEEMVVALVGSNEKNAVAKAEEIRKSIERANFNALPDVNVTVSAGVSTAMPGTNFDEVLDRADKALYEAKNSGRNQVVAWSEIE